MTAKCLFNDRIYWLHTSQVNKSDESLSVEEQCKINLCLKYVQLDFIKSVLGLKRAAHWEGTVIS